MPRRPPPKPVRSLIIAAIMAGLLAASLAVAHQFSVYRRQALREQVDGRAVLVGDLELRVPKGWQPRPMAPGVLTSTDESAVGFVSRDQQHRLAVAALAARSDVDAVAEQVFDRLIDSGVVERFRPVSRAPLNLGPLRGAWRTVLAVQPDGLGVHQVAVLRAGQRQWVIYMGSDVGAGTQAAIDIEMARMIMARILASAHVAG